MKLNGELCALRRKLSQQAGWTIVLDADYLLGIVHFNFHERSEFTSILTSFFTSESYILYILYMLSQVAVN